MDLGDFLWSLLVIFFMVIYFIMLFRVIFDVFRDASLSGWGKAGWLIALLFVPLISLLVYVIVRGPGMAERDMAQAREMQESQAAYIRDVAASSASPQSATDQIAKAHELLSAGAISQDEFNAIKTKALASA